MVVGVTNWILKIRNDERSTLPKYVRKYNNDTFLFN